MWRKQPEKRPLLRIAYLLGLVVTISTVWVKADYEIEVTLYRYWNEKHMQFDGDCCDGGGDCGNNIDDYCDNVLTVCVSDTDFRQDNPPDGCVTGSDTLQGRPNPLVFNVSGPWPSDPLRMLRVRAGDVDRMPAGMIKIESIGQIPINLTDLNPGDPVGPMQYDMTWDDYPEGIHVNLSFTLRCSENYYGLDCNRLCVATDSELGHYTCDENGTIVCNEGYRNTSSYCTEPCTPAEGCSDVGGYCDGRNNCICRPLYTGEFCQVDLDPCGHTMPCGNGATCMNSGGGDFNCMCAEGFEGESCQHSFTNECDPDPCQNGATCLFRDYTCECVDGYNGKNCTVDIDNCQSNPCIGANCTDLVADYMCMCPSGYSGRNCDEEITDSGSSSSSSPVALASGVAGLVVLVLIILVLVVVLMFVLRRKRREKVIITEKKTVPSDYEEFTRSQENDPIKPAKGTGTGSSVEHDFDNPIYGDNQDDEYATPVQPVKPVSKPVATTNPVVGVPPYEYDYTEPPSGLAEPKPIYDSADDPTTAIPQSTYSYTGPTGTTETQHDHLVPPINEYDYATAEMNQPVYDDTLSRPDPAQHYEMMPTAQGSGAEEHYDFGPI